MRACAGGDRRAFGRLYDRWSADCYTYLIHLCGNAPDADDVLQKVFLGILRRPEPFMDARNFRHYLFRVLRNEAKKRERTAVPLEAGSRSLVAEPDPEATEYGASLDLAMARLPGDQREVIVLHLHHDMKFREIAGLTGENINTIQYRYQSGLRKLQEMLRER